LYALFTVDVFVHLSAVSCRLCLALFVLTYSFLVL